MSRPSHKVLVLTGGLLTEKETSLRQAMRKQYLQSRASKSAWLDTKIKLSAVEPIVAMTLERIFGSGERRLPAQTRERMFRQRLNTDTPELTEVVLATLLDACGVEYALASYADLFTDPMRVQALLDHCGCVFASTTYLHDLSEVEPIVKMVKRPHNHVVLGGALAGLIYRDWEGMPEVDILAVGYGEFLVPALAAWIRSDYRHLAPPHGGRIEGRRHGWIVHGGTPRDNSLDGLPRPNWGLAFRDHRRRYDMIYYESVRGCPYRCSFCNYPYLFDDSRFRYRSAAQMADDWAHYVNDLGVSYITCLDSLFTVPRRRLMDLCESLVRRNIKVKWICYARADDLAQHGLLQMMKESGLHQVQIGLESGDQGMLDRMNKTCTMEANAQAIINCRHLGVTSIASLIVGYPGETLATLEATYRFLRDYSPDFYYLATFSTRATGTPVLSAESRKRSGLRTAASLYNMAPYWVHDTMSCGEAVNLVRSLNRRLMRERVSLNAMLFYAGLLGYSAADRQPLLTLQQRVATGHPILNAAFDLAHAWIDRRLAADVRRCIPGVPAQSRTASVDEMAAP